MAVVNISLVIYSRLSNSTAVICYIDPVCHHSGMRPRSAVGDPETGECARNSWQPLTHKSDLDRNII